MQLLRRMSRIFKAEAHAVVEKLEDPVKMSEQGIRDLKNDLVETKKGLAEVKAIGIQASRRYEEQKRTAQDYVKKAETVLVHGEQGAIPKAKAKELHQKALSEAQRIASILPRLEADAETHKTAASKLQANVSELEQTIQTFENELITLKARAKTAKATEKINKQLAGTDPSGTIAMLERMKAKVESEEAHALALGEMAEAGTVTLDEELAKALPSEAESADVDDLKKLLDMK